MKILVFNSIGYYFEKFVVLQETEYNASAVYKVSYGKFLSGNIALTVNEVVDDFYILSCVQLYYSSITHSVQSGLFLRAGMLPGTSMKTLVKLCCGLEHWPSCSSASKKIYNPLF